ncbi:MAG: sulfatase-like hydrolase/transferase, partial [Pirellulaceae bacterium]|nr:sulfatase-like hydrolase/transferase [Pirellulaceae bacterium]
MLHRTLAILALTLSTLLPFTGLSKDCRGAEVAKEPLRPNIIYIMTDDLGYGDLGCYGQQVIQTPNIDQMAKEGMKFTDHYAGHTVCRPSRLVLWLGQHVGHTGLTGNRPRSLTSKER